MQHQLQPEGALIDGGAIRLVLTLGCEQVSCDVTDDGAALAVLNPGTGIRLIDSLAAELDGRIQCHFGPDNTSVTLLYPFRLIRHERDPSRSAAP
jgi:hypothetical protein